MDDKRRDFLKQYKKNNLKRVVLNVKNDVYEQIKLAAELDGVSVSRYIKGLIAADLIAKQNTIEYRIAVGKKSADSGQADYFSGEHKQETERVVFTVVDQDGKKRGSAVALVTPEEAKQYRDAQSGKPCKGET